MVSPVQLAVQVVWLEVHAGGDGLSPRVGCGGERPPAGVGGRRGARILVLVSWQQFFRRSLTLRFDFSLTHASLVLVLWQ